MTDRHLTPQGEIVAGPEGLRRVLFSRAELACRLTGVLRLRPGFADQLAQLRLAFGRPMRVTSCCRSSAHNANVGGHPNSLHVYDRPHRAAPEGPLGSCAIDVARGASDYNMALLRLAVEAGWSLGVAKTFFHLDRRVDLGLPQNVFGY